MARARAEPKPAPPPAKPISFLAFLEGSDFCGLDLSPAMAGIAAASEGAPVDLDEATCRALFACRADQLPREPRRTVAVSAGGRSGKTYVLVAGKALHAALTVPLPTLGRGERARAVIVCPDRDLAEQALDYVRGFAESSPVMREMLVLDRSGRVPKTRVRIRRADGAEVDIVVGSATRGGRAVRARCLVGVFLDEASFFFTDEQHAVTDKEIYRAAIQRVVPGGQIWIVSTPWIEEQGLLEERIKDETFPPGHERAGDRRHERTLAVARASTRLLNPAWDTDGSIEADMRASDPENTDREIHAIPLGSGTSSYFDSEAIRRMFEHEAFASAAIGVGVGGDFGLTSDCSAAVATRRHAGDCFDAFDAFERRPRRGEPLKPSETFGDAARFVLAAGARAIAADHHYKESVREHVVAVGVAFLESPGGPEGKVSTYSAARQVMQEGRSRCSIADPALRARFREQLRSITKKPLPGGGIQISAPRRRAGPTGASGGHGDLVSGWVLSMWRCGAGKTQKTGKSRKVRGGAPTRWSRGMMGAPAADPRTGGKRRVA